MSVESSGCTSSGGHSRYFSIRLHLALLVAATLVPMLALIAIVSWDYVVASRQTIAAQRLDVTNNLTNLVEREIASIGSLLEGVAASGRFLDDDGDADVEADTVMAEVARSHGFESVAVFDIHGRTLEAVSTGRRQLFPTAEDAEAFRAISQDRMVVSNLQTRLGAPYLFFVSVPISRKGQPKIVISVGVAASRLQGLFAEAGLREGWRAGVVDRSGAIVARSRGAEDYVGKPAQRPMMEAARGQEDAGVFDIVSSDGDEVRNAFRRSAMTNWTVGVAVPASVESAPLWSIGLSMTTLAVGLILAGLVLSAVIANRIASAVNMVGRAAVALVTNDSVPLPPRTLVELRDVLALIESLSRTRPKGSYLQP